MYLGFVNCACCVIMFAAILLIADQQFGFTDDHYVEVGNLVRFFKTLV